MDEAGSRKGLIMGLCEHGNEPYSSVVGVECVTVSVDISFMSFQEIL